MRKAYFTFEFEDTKYTLKYDYNAICDIEEVADKSITALLDNDRVGQNTARLLLYGGLKWADRGMSKAKAGSLIARMIDAGESALLEKVVSEAVKLLVKAIQPDAVEADEETEIKN